MTATSYDFMTIYSFWNNIWETFIKFTTFMNADITPYVENFINTYFQHFDITIDIPFSWSFTDLFGGTLLMALCGLGIVAFAFRLVKDIINPFN